MAYNLPPKTLPRFDVLRRNGRNIRLHGNRFIQIDLGPGVRMHVWSDILPMAQVLPAPIHTHDYDFSSRILSGWLVNVRFTQAHTYPSTVTPNDGSERYHDLYQVDRAAGILIPRNLTVELTIKDVVSYRTGNHYHMKWPEIHATSYIGHAITCIIAGQPTSSPPVVFLPQGISPDNEYRRDKYAEDYLWDLVAEVYRSIVLPPETGLQEALRDWNKVVNPIN